MAAEQPRRPTPAKPAENDAAWPSLAALLAPAAGCDCQVLAVTLARGLENRPVTPRR